MAIEFRFQNTLDILRKDLQQLLRQKEDIEKQIAATKQSLSGLLMLRDAALEDTEPPTMAHLFPADYRDDLAIALGLPAPSAKLKDLCRSVVRSSEAPLTAPQVKVEVELMGFDFSGYDSNPLSSIHTVLRRIPEIQYSKLDGKTVYEWKGIQAPPPMPVMPDQQQGPPPMPMFRKKKKK